MRKSIGSSPKSPSVQIRLHHRQKICVYRLLLTYFMDRASAPVSLFRCPARDSEEHTSELQSLMRISYAVFYLQKNTKIALKKTSDHKQLRQTTYDDVVMKKNTLRHEQANY